MVRLTLIVKSLLFTIVVVVSGTHGNADNVDSSDSIFLPRNTDLIVYLKSLRRIIGFCAKHKNDLDLNFEFGLFLTNVNLKNALNIKRIHIPQTLRNYLKLLLRENDNLIEFFESMVRDNDDSRQEFNKMIFSLFSNETHWKKQISKFNLVILNEAEGDIPATVVNSWPQYVKRVDNMDNAVPDPRLSDMCMVSLARNTVHDSVYFKCSVEGPCYDMLVNGTDFGYALTHRLLFMLQARYSRGCSVFSSEQDKELREWLCAIAYNEAEYIAMHSYGIIDLFLEQITICSMDGHPQFLRRDWLSNILQYQTSFGCFGQTRNPSTELKASLIRTPRAWKLAKHRDHTIMGGLCNGHVTSVAAATLATAIRYILETYY